MEQLYNKIHAVKKLLDKNPIMTDTFQMRQIINQHLEVPGVPVFFAWDPGSIQPELKIQYNFLIIKLSIKVSSDIQIH